MPYHCVYFKTSGDSDALKKALEQLGVRFTSFETLSASHAEHMAESLRAAHEMVLRAWDAVKTN
jgi:hypothetical protein